MGRNRSTRASTFDANTPFMWISFECKSTLVGAIFKVNRETGDILSHSVGVQIEYWPEEEDAAMRRSK